MTARTAWTAGNGVGFTWTACFGSADLTSLASGDSVLSSVSGGVTNQTALDTMMDISVKITVTSSTPSAGAVIGLYAYYLSEDGSEYGDNQLTAGTGAAYVPPPYALLGNISLANSAMTVMTGTLTGLVIYPGTFAFVLYNGSGVAFSATAANNVCKYRTYNLQLNN